MPMMTDSSVNSRTSIGWLMMPSFISTMLMAPSLPSIGRQASTRIRNDVQNGMTQITSRIVDSVLDLMNSPTNSAVG